MLLVQRPHRYDWRSDWRTWWSNREIQCTLAQMTHDRQDLPVGLYKGRDPKTVLQEFIRLDLFKIIFQLKTIFFWLHWVFAAAQAFSNCSAQGFSLWWLVLLRSTGSTACRLSSSRAQLLRGMWDLPAPGNPCTTRRIPNYCTTREARLEGA